MMGMMGGLEGAWGEHDDDGKSGEVRCGDFSRMVCDQVYGEFAFGSEASGCHLEVLGDPPLLRAVGGAAELAALEAMGGEVLGQVPST